MCRRLLGNDADAADATQQALIAVVRGLPRFDGRSAFSTWVYRVTTNAALDEIRRRGRRPQLLPDPEGVERPSSRRTAGPEGAGPSLDDQVADRLDLDDALGQLPAEFRAVVVLRDVMGLDYAEIAEVLDLPPGTVRSRIARGRAALARSLRRPEPPDLGNQRRPPDVGRDGPP